MGAPQLKPRPHLDLLRGTLAPRLASRIQSARELLQPPERLDRQAPMATGWPELDRLLAGGLERGALTELVGEPSSGRFTLVLGVVARTTALGEAAALVDLGGHLEPESVRLAGGAPDRLLWLLPQHLRQAQAAAEKLIACGIPLVVLDLGSPPIAGGRGAEGAWMRLARAARARRAVFLLASPYRASGTAAAVVLKARKERVRWQGAGAARLLGGVDVSLWVEKSRLQAPSAPPPRERLSLQVEGCLE
jgi:RecA/RadA recombinase